MVGFLRFHCFLMACTKKPKFLIKTIALKKCCFSSYENLASSVQSSPLIQSYAKNNVAVFWNFRNKPSKYILPFDVAIKLKAAASSFGRVRYNMAFSDIDALTYETPVVNKLGKNGTVRPSGPHLCYVCGRKFCTNDRLINHFRQVHEPEHAKRVNQIESAKGSKRVKLVGKYSMKMERFKRAVQCILLPKKGHDLIEDLRRVGLFFRVVSNENECVDLVLKNEIVDVINRGQTGCLFVVSDDVDLVGVVLDAKKRCMRTVVINDSGGSTLKRVADAGFCWKEVMTGKVKKDGPKVVRRWNDRDILNRLEWTYKPETEKKSGDLDDDVCLEGEDGEIPWWEGNKKQRMKRDRVWWKLDSGYRETYDDPSK